MENGVCSFSGHRNIETAHKTALPPLVARGIEYAYSKGCRNFLSGGAIGFDTLAAQEVIKFRATHRDVRLVLVLPCKNQSEKWNFRQKQEYEKILKSADEIIYITDSYYDGCIKERNMRLAEEADILICYASRFNSGTGQTVRMAKSMGKDVYNLYPALDKNS